MKPEEFLQTIYLGDRACKTILIESWKRRVAIQVDVISRLRPGTQIWDYYTEGDVTNGWLVFSEVRSISFQPSGPVANDYIISFTVKPIESKENRTVYLFDLAIGAVDMIGESTEVHVKIEASRFHLEDSGRSGVGIVD